MTYDELVQSHRQAEWDATTNDFLAKKRAKARRAWAAIGLFLVGLVLAGAEGPSIVPNLIGAGLILLSVLVGGR